LAFSGGEIDSFIARLAAQDCPPGLFNLYELGNANNAIRRENLRLYLREMVPRAPRALLVMEAPGYRGCRLTGIPVCSRKIMLGGLRSLGMFGAMAGYRDVADVGFERLQGEQSASILWRALAELEQLPLLWNAVPFHPHRLGKPLSNRRPRQAEIALGWRYLQLLLRDWQFELVLAVGNVAHGSLQAGGIDCVKLRHPAHGGKSAFRRGLAQQLGSTAG